MLKTDNMRKIEIKDVEKVQATLRDDLAKYYRKGKYNEFLSLIDTFAEYTAHYNNVFVDEVVESLLKEFSETQIGVADVDVKESKRIVVFYDQIGTTICLGLQYIKGLLSAGYHVFYVFDSVTVDIKKDLLEELEYLNIDKKIFDRSFKKGLPIDRIKSVRDYIASIGAETVLVHSPAACSYSSVVLYSLKGMVRYRIVPGDHHFYTGVGCIDYFFEFREYGIGIANTFRRIPMNKIIKLPYYPIVKSNSSFEGYPVRKGDNIIIISAGHEGKFFGSDLFFDVCKYILKKYSKAIILHIGNYTKSFTTFVHKNGLEDRFFLLGYRTDFNGCIENCNILLSSYPMIGGLISQIAGLYSRPIIGMKENDEFCLINDIEDILGINTNLGITHSLNIGLYSYIDKLITDEVYRKQIGREIHEYMFTEEKFNNRLQKILSNQEFYAQESYGYKKEIVLKNKEQFTQYCLCLQNERRPNSIYPLYMFYGKRFFYKFPYLIGAFIKLTLMHIADRMN